MLARRSSEHGFSLIEALVGLLLIGITLLFTMSLVAQQPGVERRLAAHREALYLAETQLELMRSTLETPKRLESSSDGEVEIEERLLNSLEVLMRPEARRFLAADDLPRMWVKVDALPPSLLYQVEVKVRYVVAGEPFELQLESMIWRLELKP